MNQSILLSLLSGSLKISTKMTPHPPKKKKKKKIIWNTNDCQHSKTIYVSKLVFYAQSTSAVISGRSKTRSKHIKSSKECYLLEQKWNLQMCLAQDDPVHLVITAFRLTQNIIIITDNFCIVLFSDVHELTVLYNTPTFSKWKQNNQR